MQLYTLYLCKSNFSSIIQPLYIESQTSSSIVRLALSQQLRDIARSELLKSSPTIDVEAIYRESSSALEALSTLLGQDSYFFAVTKPGLFDAAVFAYSNLLLDDSILWAEDRMREDLKEWSNLVDHRERILHEYFPSQ